MSNIVVYKRAFFVIKSSKYCVKAQIIRHVANKRQKDVLLCIAVPFGTCRQRNRGKIGKTDTQNTKSHRLGTTESFSLLPLPLLLTRCQALALHPEQQAFACRRLPIRHIQSACVFPTGFGQTLKRQLSAHLRNSLTSKCFAQKECKDKEIHKKIFLTGGRFFRKLFVFYKLLFVGTQIVFIFHKLFGDTQIISNFPSRLQAHNCFNFLHIV